MKRRKKGKQFSCAVKLYMMKAYDCVEWHYLEAMLLRLGFNANFVRLIMRCVTSVRFSVRMNGELLPSFTPSRGLRQGCPASPFLFLLCAEGLTSLLNHFGGHYVDRGIWVSCRSPWINHLLFADDSLILMKANAMNAEVLKSALDSYCATSGQLVSVEKSSIFFSPNTKVEDRAQICTTLNIMTEALNDKYLGLPANVGMDKSDCFQFLIDRIITKISGWKEKLLSAGGKEILLKSVVQAIPAYAMSVFKIPKKIVKESLTRCRIFGGVTRTIRK